MLNIFKERNISFDVTLYSENDIATSIDISNIINNWDVFENLYKEYIVNDIENIEDYYFYLLSEKFVGFSNYVEFVVPEHKEKIESLSKSASEYIANFKKRNLIEYINLNFKEIFTKENNIRGIHSRTMDLLGVYYKGISKKVFFYLLDKHKSLLLVNFKRFERLFEEEVHLFSKLLEDIDVGRNIYLEYTLNILKLILNKKNTNLKKYAENYAENLEVNMLDIVKNEDIEVFIRKKLLETYLDFLYSIKSTKFFIFENEMIKITEELERYLQNEGQHISYTLSVKNEIEKWDNFDRLNINKLWIITHNNLKSNLDNHNNEKTLVDFVLDSNEVDDYFTIMHKNYLELLFDMGSIFLHNIFIDNIRVQEYGNLLFSSIEYLRKNNIFNDRYIGNDLYILSSFLRTLHVNIDNDEKTLEALCYSTSVFLISFTEKLIRLVYEYEATGKVYFIPGKATMGNLLENNEILNDIFGEKYIKNLGYYFIVVGKNKIGKNLRNDLVHLTRGIEEKLSVLTVMGLFYLLTDVVNTIFIKYNKDLYEKN